MFDDDDDDDDDDVYVLYSSVQVYASTCHNVRCVRIIMTMARSIPVSGIKPEPQKLISKPTCTI